MSQPTSTDHSTGVAGDRLAAYPRAWDPPDDEISLFDIWDALVRRRWLMLVVFVAVTALAAAFALSRPDVYRYEARLEIGRDHSGNPIATLKPLPPSSTTGISRTRYATSTTSRARRWRPARPMSPRSKSPPPKIAASCA